jgi:hypothetical protein
MKYLCIWKQAKFVAVLCNVATASPEDRILLVLKSGRGLDFTFHSYLLQRSTQPGSQE